jgi:hypothetical protein
LDRCEECGYVVTLAAEEPADKLAAVLAIRPEVKIVDFTGSSAFGEWLEGNARQALVYTEKSGVNTVVIDSVNPTRYGWACSIGIRCRNEESCMMFSPAVAAVIRESKSRWSPSCEAKVLGPAGPL